MKNIRRLISLISLAAALVSGCGSTATSPSDNGRSTLTVTVRETGGAPLGGFTVTASTGGTSAVTDSAGIALFERVSSGDIEITVRKDGYPPFSRTISVTGGKPAKIDFVYLPVVNVTVVDDKGRPVRGAVMTTAPATHTGTTDGGGRATFDRMPLTTLKFSVERTGAPVAEFTTQTSETLRFVIQAAAPVVEILSPEVNAALANPKNVTFSGKAYDFEDGELPDSSLVWTSNVDGVLGRGKTLQVPLLSQGFHSVTLTGTDSDGLSREATISFSVFDYQLDSFFPIPGGEIWTYRYLVPEFYLTNSENVNEYWVLKTLTAKMTKDSNRVIDIYWDTVASNITTHFRLTLTDSLVLEDDTMYITQTVERSSEWQGSVEKPYFTVQIGTTYLPRYVFLKSLKNISAAPSYQSTVRAETEYSYTYYSTNSPLFHDSKAITSSVTVGDEEFIQTDRGLMRGTLVTFLQGAAEKRWYLTKGLGIVRIEDTALNISTAAVLSTATLLRFINPAIKPAFHGPAAVTGTPVRFDLKIDRGKTEDALRLHRFLASMAPR